MSITPFHALIAADGGLYLTQALKLKADILIGDFDTISYEDLENCRNSGTTVLPFPADKDSSDTELAILKAASLGATRITLIGVLGGQWDHTITNLLAPLALCHQLGIWARILQSTASVYYLTRGVFELRLPLGTRVSLAPLSETVEGVTLRGLAYPLLNEKILRNQSRTLGNYTIDAKTLASIDQGEALLTITPLAPEATEKAIKKSTG